MTPDQLLQGFRDGRWMPLRGAEALPQQLLPPGPGVLVSSGGSSGSADLPATPAPSQSIGSGNRPLVAGHWAGSRRGSDAQSPADASRQRTDALVA